MNIENDWKKNCSLGWYIGFVLFFIHPGMGLKQSVLVCIVAVLIHFLE